MPTTSATWLLISHWRFAWSFKAWFIQSKSIHWPNQTDILPCSAAVGLFSLHQTLTVISCGYMSFGKNVILQYDHWIFVKLTIKHIKWGYLYILSSEYTQLWKLRWNLNIPGGVDLLPGYPATRPATAPRRLPLLMLRGTEKGRWSAARVDDNQLLFFGHSTRPSLKITSENYGNHGSLVDKNQHMPKHKKKTNI